MKRLLLLLPFAIWLGWTAIHADRAESGGNPLQLAVKSAVMLDAETGEWLYSYRGDEAFPPASMSKMMTELIVLDELKAGKLKWKDRIKVSDYAATVGGAGMGLRPGQSVSIREMFEAMAIHSANDAAVALAEGISGTEPAFVERMNRKAKEIGLSGRTKFANATGLWNGNSNEAGTQSKRGQTRMSAKDAAMLAAHLIRVHPDILQTTRKAETESGSVKAVLRTTNEMLPGGRFGTKGNDGLKTGYTEQAGYCFTGTTERDGRRLITVVMGTATPEARFEETRKLLQFGWGDGA